jgi:hypothetical protein
MKGRLPGGQERTPQRKVPGSVHSVATPPVMANGADFSQTLLYNLRVISLEPEPSRIPCWDEKQ